jgi:hypothetical protein
MEDDDGGNNARRRPLDGVEDAIRELQRRSGPTSHLGGVSPAPAYEGTLPSYRAVTRSPRRAHGRNQQPSLLATPEEADGRHRPRSLKLM